MTASLQVPAGHQIEIHNEFFMQIRSRRWRVKLLTVTFYFIVNYFYTMREFFNAFTEFNKKLRKLCDCLQPKMPCKREVTAAKLMQNYLKFNGLFIHTVLNETS